MSEATDNARQAAERAKFDAWITSPPMEYEIERYPNDPSAYSWPENYKDFRVQIAWEAWRQSAIDAETTALREQHEERIATRERVCEVLRERVEELERTVSRRDGKIETLLLACESWRDVEVELTTERDEARQRAEKAEAHDAHVLKRFQDILPDAPESWEAIRERVRELAGKVPE